MCEFLHDLKLGKITGVRILGKRDKDIACDAVVMCTGAWTARSLSTLRVRCPVLPLKSYSFDMPTQAPPLHSLLFEDKHFSACSLRNGMLRVNIYGDLAGFDQSFDARRIRNLLNIVAKTLDTQEAMKNSDLRAVLTGVSPDDLPLVGRLKHFPNLYINAGHGSRAATLSFACGAAMKGLVNGD